MFYVVWSVLVDRTCRESGAQMYLDKHCVEQTCQLGQMGEDAVVAKCEESLKHNAEANNNNKNTG